MTGKHLLDTNAAREALAAALDEDQARAWLLQYGASALEELERAREVALRHMDAWNAVSGHYRAVLNAAFQTSTALRSGQAAVAAEYIPDKMLGDAFSAWAFGMACLETSDESERVVKTCERLKRCGFKGKELDELEAAMKQKGAAN